MDWELISFIASHFCALLTGGISGFWKLKELHKHERIGFLPDVPWSVDIVFSYFILDPLIFLMGRYFYVRCSKNLRDPWQVLQY